MTTDLSSTVSHQPVGDPVESAGEPGPVGERDAESSLPRPFGGAAQRMFAETDAEGTLRVVAILARQTYRCDAVGILLTHDGSVVAAAATGADATHADSLQVNHHQGPGVQAIQREQPVIVTELRSDSRWRFWSPMAADLGFRSVLSIRLADGDMVGALTLYSRTARQFQTSDLLPVTEFAECASIAIAVAQEREQLMQAIESRGIVGQAQGILIQLYGITPAQAFNVLRRYSSHANIKLRMIAEVVIRDRDLPAISGTPAFVQSPSVLAG